MSQPFPCGLIAPRWSGCRAVGGISGIDGGAADQQRIIGWRAGQRGQHGISRLSRIAAIIPFFNQIAIIDAQVPQAIAPAIIGYDAIADCEGGAGRKYTARTWSSIIGNGDMRQVHCAAHRVDRPTKQAACVAGKGAVADVGAAACDENITAA